MNKVATKQDILNTVSIIKIAEEAGIVTEECSTGNFDYRCRCPSKKHKGGTEKTASLYIDSVKNNFYCYGCSASSNVIDFYMMLTDVSFIEAFRTLQEIAVPSGEAESFKRESNFNLLVEISELFRENLLLNKHDLKWLNNIIKKTDEYIELIDPTDLAATKSLLNSLKKKFNERYRK